MTTIKRIALTLVIIGAVNWGLIGFFQFDLVASLFGGQSSFISRVIFALVGLSGLLCLPLLFEPAREEITRRENRLQSGKINYGTEFGEETDVSDEVKQKRDDLV